MLSNPSETRISLLIHRIKAFLGLETFLVVLVRMALITSFVSIVSYRLAPHDNPRFGWDVLDVFHGFTDLLLICWLVISVAIFIPFAPLIDPALCAVILLRKRSWDILRWFIHWTPEERSMVYLKDLDSFVEIIVVTTIAALRVLGLTLAMVEAYCSEGQIDKDRLSRTLFNYIVRYEYDWWTCKPLPKGFPEQKWYQRAYRPWLQTIPPSSVPWQLQPGEVAVVPLVQILFGARTFHSRRGERFWFVIVRGAIAMACLGGLIAYAANALFLQLNDEIRAPNIEMRRAPILPGGAGMSPPIWGVIVGINSRFVELPAGVSLDKFVSVIQEVQSTPIDTASCSPIGFSSRDENLKYFYLVSYQCTTLWQAGPLAYTPQIRIRMDYAALNITLSNFTPEKSVKIWPRLTSSVANVLASTKPTSLVMGRNLIASVEETLRSRSTTPIRAALGVDSSHETHLIAQVSVLGVDPLAEPRLNQTGTLASIRLFKEVQTTGWELYADAKKHTVLSGLSALGGLAVFFNSAFVVLFGGGLILVLFNIKPLSIFGIFHLFSKATLSHRFSESFPYLHAEGSHPGQSNSGVVSFMREYMVDLAPLPPGRNHLDCGTSDSMVTTCTTMGV